MVFVELNKAWLETCAGMLLTSSEALKHEALG